MYNKLPHPRYGFRNNILNQCKVSVMWQKDQTFQLIYGTDDDDDDDDDDDEYMMTGVQCTQRQHRAPPSKWRFCSETTHMLPTTFTICISSSPGGDDDDLVGNYLRINPGDL